MNFRIILCFFALNINYGTVLATESQNSTARPKFLEHFRAPDICKSVLDHEVWLESEELQTVRALWAKDIQSLETKLDQIFKSKNVLQKTYLWAHERNLQTFPSGLILSTKGLEKPARRLSFYKDIIASLDKSFLLGHILQQEVSTFSLREGEGKYSQVLVSYVDSFIHGIAPNEDIFIQWLKDSCNPR